jgi:hypothetical protein
MFTAVKRTLSVVRAFMMHIGYGPAAPTRHNEDNQPSIDIVSANQVIFPVRYIHNPICYLFIINWIVATSIQFFCKGTLIMRADSMCTKPVAGPLLERHHDFIGCLQFAAPSTVPFITLILFY